MMHLHMLAVAVAVSVLARFLYRRIDSSRSWQMRWHLALTAFVVPPLLLLATTVAILLMGVGGTVYAWDGLLSYGLSLAFVLLALALWLQLSWLTHKNLREIRRSPKSLIEAGGVRSVGRVMDLSTVFSAQVGVWSSELVMSQALLTHLDEPHLEAVLAHEMGHAHYRDTFWFFWLGGVRRLTIWLPFTEVLWQELLLLRELRADSWATQFVDRLVLAEALVEAIAAPMTADSCAALSCAVPSRLSRRIDALLDEDVTAPAPLGTSLLQWTPLRWTELSFSLAPLLTIPFHH